MILLFSSIRILAFLPAVIPYCPDSLKTMERVPHCPENYTAWKTMSSKKKCEDFKQTCTAPSNFMYHCVINSFLNETIEVCAPTAFITGYCCEFNAIGAVIQRNYDADCRNFSSEPCVDPYFSYEGYKHPGCYALVQQRGYQNTTVRLDTDNKTRTGDHEENEYYLVHILVITISALSITVVLLTIAWNRKGIFQRLQNCCGPRDQLLHIDAEMNTEMKELQPNNRTEALEGEKSDPVVKNSDVRRKGRIRNKTTYYEDNSRRKKKTKLPCL